jgi:hypothetical protein
MGAAFAAEGVCGCSANTLHTDDPDDANSIRERFQQHSSFSKFNPKAPAAFSSTKNSASRNIDFAFTRNLKLEIRN